MYVIKWKVHVTTTTNIYYSNVIILSLKSLSGTERVGSSGPTQVQIRGKWRSSGGHPPTPSFEDQKLTILEPCLIFP